MQQEALFAMPNAATSQLQCCYTFKNAMNITDKKQEEWEEMGEKTPLIRLEISRTHKLKTGLK